MSDTTTNPGNSENTRLDKCPENYTKPHPIQNAKESKIKKKILKNARGGKKVLPIEKHR